MAHAPDNTQAELARRHGATVRVVSAVFTLTLVLAALALLLTPRLSRFSNPVGALTLLFVILFIALGSIVFRRTKFSAMRLRDIAALRGASGLLETLQRTTVYVALAGGVIALLGFAFTVMSGDRTNAVYPAVIAVAVLAYCYPRRAAWRGALDALADSDEVAGGSKGTTA